MVSKKIVGPPELVEWILLVKNCNDYDGKHVWGIFVLDHIFSSKIDFHPLNNNERDSANYLFELPYGAESNYLPRDISNSIVTYKVGKPIYLSWKVFKWSTKHNGKYCLKIASEVREPTDQEIEQYTNLK